MAISGDLPAHIAGRGGDTPGAHRRERWRHSRRPSPGECSASQCRVRMCAHAAKAAAHRRPLDSGARLGWLPAPRLSCGTAVPFGQLSAYWLGCLPRISRSRACKPFLVGGRHGLASSTCPSGAATRGWTDPWAPQKVQCAKPWTTSTWCVVCGCKRRALVRNGGSASSTAGTSTI